MRWLPIKYFLSSPHISVMASQKAHGDMRVSSGYSGKRNRRIFVDGYIYPGAKDFPASVEHKNRVITVNGNFQDLPSKTDSLVTVDEEKYLGMPFADCPPVILSGFCHSRKPILALVHGGYEPVLQGVIAKTIRVMAEETEEKAFIPSIQVLIGPGICKNCYEFGPEAPRRFRNYPEQVSYLPDKGKYLVDLPGIIREQLKQAGIPEKNISTSRLCTFETPYLFSARREKARPLDPQNPVRTCMVFAGIKRGA